MTTNEQLANILTKPLGWIKFHYFRNRMGVQNLSKVQ